MRFTSRPAVPVFALGVAIVLVLAGVAGSQQSARRYVEPGGPGTDNPDRAYSRAVHLGDALYVAGNTGTMGTSGNLDADLEAEIRSLLDRMQATIEAESLTMDDLVWVQVFCTDLALYGKFNQIYRSYFTGPLPARAFIGTSTLLGNAHFEIMGTAVRP